MNNETGEKSIFGMEATVSQNAAGIMRILVLMRMDEMLRAQEAYDNATQGSGEQARLKARAQNSTYSLLRLLRARMKEKKKYDDVYKKVNEDTDEAISLIMEYLENDLKLTKIDTRQEFEPTDITKRNKVKLGY